jgi:predicted metal-dependent phosphoesterase TrpH
VSDHNDADGARQAQEYVEANRKGEIVIVPGQEYSCCRIHMNILLLNRTIAPTSPWPSNEELARVVREVHAEGGLVVVNHPAWSNRTTYPYQQATLPDHPSLQELLDMGVDGVEVVNGQVYDARTHLFQQANPSALFALTGSDVHDPDGAYAWTALHAPALTLPAIVAELRAHRTAIYMDAAGTRARVYPEVSTLSAWFLPIRTAASLFSMLVEHERGMYSFQGSFCHPEILRPRWTVILASVVYIVLGISLWLFVRPRVIRMAHRTYRWVRHRRRF